MKTYPTYFDPALADTGDDTFVLTGKEAHHASRVRRIRVGEIIDVVNGSGLRIRGPVTAVEREDLTVAIEERWEEPAPQVSIVLAQALAKGGRDEAAIEAATEVGADGFIAWESARSVSQWRGDKERKGLQRWESIIAAAMKQSRRAWLPHLHGFARGAQISELIADDAQVLILHERATQPLTGVNLPEQGAIVLVVGPEGGLSTEEVEELGKRRGAVPVRLGTEVVRTSTAGPAALAVLNARLGRW